jgi:hypothetical protein
MNSAAVIEVRVEIPEENLMMRKAWMTRSGTTIEYTLNQKEKKLN